MRTHIRTTRTSRLHLLYIDTPTNYKMYDILHSEKCRRFFWYHNEYLLWLASQWGVWDILNDCVLAGVNVNFNARGMSPLDTSIKRFRGNDTSIQLLLDAGADANTLKSSTMIELIGGRNMKTIKIVSEIFDTTRLYLALDLARGHDRHRVARYLLKRLPK